MWSHSGFRDGETTWIIWMGPECHHNFFSEWQAGGDFIEREDDRTSQKMIGQSLSLSAEKDCGC